MNLKAIPIKVPRIPFEPKRQMRVINNVLDEVAKNIKIDFDVTTQTWEHRPSFKVELIKDGRFISTRNQIYDFVNAGTRPHIIVPKNASMLRFPAKGFSAKTRVGQIRSLKGSKGSGTAYALIVHHPGTKAREFAEAIANKHKKTIRTKFSREIWAELNR